MLRGQDDRIVFGIGLVGLKTLQWLLPTTTKVRRRSDRTLWVLRGWRVHMMEEARARLLEDCHKGEKVKPHVAFSRPVREARR